MYINRTYKLHAIIIIILAALLYSCSGNKGGSDIVVPEAPTNLSGNAISATQVELNWSDNSSTEQGFKIERQQGSGSFTVVGTVSNNTSNFTDNNLTTNQTYNYRVASFNDAGQSQSYSNTVSISLNNLPVIATRAASEVSYNYALTGGSIYSDGGSPVIARGVCWNQTGNPTISLPTKTVDSSGNGNYISFVPNLTPGSSYYVRAYATNANGTSYGQQIQFTAATIDSVVICGKVWMKYNLGVTRYKNGDPIIPITEAPNWNQPGFTTGAYADNIALTNTNPKAYGLLYNYYAVIDPRGIAPDGWRVPTASELEDLKICTNSMPGNGGALKMTGTEFWNAPNDGANNLTGFSAVGAGIKSIIEIFSGNRDACVFLSTDAFGTNGTKRYYLSYNDFRLTYVTSYSPRVLSTVRLIKE